MKKLPTPEHHKAFILAHYRIDMKAIEIANQLGMTLVAVNNAAHRLRKKGLMGKRKNLLGTSRALPLGTEKTVTTPEGRTHTIKKTEAGWRYQPTGAKRPKKPKTAKKKPQVRKVSTRPDRVSGTGAEVAKQRFIPNTARPPIEKAVSLRTDRNPDKVKVKKEVAGYWERRDARTLVFKKQKDAA